MLQLINDSILMWEPWDYLKVAGIIAVSILFGFKLVFGLLRGLLQGVARK